VFIDGSPLNASFEYEFVNFSVRDFSRRGVRCIHEHAIVDVITEPMFLIGNHGKHINKKY